MKFKVYMLAFENGKIRKVDVPDNELTGVAEHDLERIFYWGQNDFQPQKICSVSCGDVVEYNSKLYLTLMAGFKEITPEEMESLKKMDYFKKCNFVMKKLK